MKKTTKKLFMSSLALTFAAATTISTTYAWFTMQTTAKVDQIDLNVTSGEGFEIAFATLSGVTFTEPLGTTYKQTLKFADLKTAIGATTFTNLQLAHVTSTNGEAFKTLDDTTTPGTPDFSVDATANTHYLEFQIWFRGQRDYDINLSTTNTYGWSNGSSIIANSAIAGANRFDAGNTIDPENPDRSLINSFMSGTRSTATVAESAPIYAFSADAARVSFNDMSGAIATTVVKLTESGYGDTQDGATNLALAYYNSIYGGTVTVPTETTKPATAITITDAADGVGDITDNTLMKLSTAATSGYHYGSINVRVWLEGWDADCFNAIFADTLHIALSFNGSNPTV